MQTALIVIHVVISIALIAVVLMQHGKQSGMSGAIAGGAETFFGRNKGRTIDAMLKKVTAVIAILFIASSITLAVYSINQNKAENAANATTQTEQSQDGGIQASLDDEGNLVDAEGNILMTAEEVAKAQTEAAENAGSESNNEQEKTETPAE